MSKWDLFQPSKNIEADLLTPCIATPCALPCCCAVVALERQRIILCISTLRGAEQPLVLTERWSCKEKQPEIQGKHTAVAVNEEIVHQ